MSEGQIEALIRYGLSREEAIEQMRIYNTQIKNKSIYLGGWMQSSPQYLNKEESEVMRERMKNRTSCYRARGGGTILYQCLMFEKNTCVAYSDCDCNMRVPIK